MAQAPFRNQPLLTEAELQQRLGEFYAAVEEFNDGYFFESHETLEDLWMVTPLPERTFFQGIIQLAAAFVHAARDEYPGVLKLLDAAETKLREFAPESLGVDVAALVRDLSAVREVIEATGSARLREFDLTRAPHINVAR